MGLAQNAVGIHEKFARTDFQREENRIIKKLAQEWLVTRSVSGPLADSNYKGFLIKPTTRVILEMFNLEKEIICVMSPHERFESRDLEAFTVIQEGVSDLRTESGCKVLISKDPKIEAEIENLVKNDPELPIVVPFTYEELLNSADPFFIRNRFSKHFYSRNLFEFLSPLKKDLYFFGRSQLVRDIVNRHKSGEHTGLFGLRKSGKTSIIYAVERMLKDEKRNYVSIDCESPSVHLLRWNELLERTMKDYHAAIGSKAKIDTAGRYEEKFASDNFQQDMIKIFKSKKRQSTLFLFDEIERITPGTASSSHWRDSVDFIYFWQALRAFYQRNPEILTYMLVGTNPSSVEQAMFFGHENPLYASIPSQYVPSFEVAQVRDMVRLLGKYSGLKFDEIIFSKLTEDFGGVPFLIRQACSIIHQYNMTKPVFVDKALYEKSKKQYCANSADHLGMIVNVLKDWYPNEYEMLKFLALDDMKSFNELALDDPSYTKHLVAYGLVQRSDHGFAFNTEILKDYLRNEHLCERLNLTDDEMVEEISRRRNIIERLLRKAIRNALKLTYGQNKAAGHLLAAIPENRRSSLQQIDIDGLLAPDSSPLFFLDLISVLTREWECVQNVFTEEKSQVILMLKEVNRYGRPDAHAQSITKDEFDQLRLYFNRLEPVLQAWD